MKILAPPARTETKATVVGSDDFKGSFAGLAWVAPAGGTYRLRVTSFEGISTGGLQVARK